MFLVKKHVDNISWITTADLLLFFKSSGLIGQVRLVQKRGNQKFSCKIINSKIIIQRHKINSKWP